MDRFAMPAVSASSIAARTIRSTLRSGLPLRLARSEVRHSNARLRAGSPLPGKTLFSIAVHATLPPYRNMYGTTYDREVMEPAILAEGLVKRFGETAAL